MDEINLGDVARDRLTGLEGVVVARTVWLNNCDRIVIQPEGVFEGKPADACGFDLPNMELVRHTDHKVWPPTHAEEPIELGDLARCRLTGLVGVAVGQTSWLNGCSRITLQPRELVKGKPADYVTLDETDMLVVERQAFQAKPASKAPEAEGQKSGGPMPDTARR